MILCKILFKSISTVYRAKGGVAGLMTILKKAVNLKRPERLRNTAIIVMPCTLSTGNPFGLYCKCVLFKIHIIINLRLGQDTQSSTYIASVCRNNFLFFVAFLNVQY